MERGLEEALKSIINQLLHRSCVGYTDSGTRDGEGAHIQPDD